MAIGWMSVLKAVPWGDVISNAPAIADGANKLWKRVRKTEVEPGGESTEIDLEAGQTARLAALEAQIEELHRQMEASSELINQLAQQNAQLVARIELFRRRARRQMAIVAGVAGASLMVAVWLLGRGFA